MRRRMDWRPIIQLDHRYTLEWEDGDDPPVIFCTSATQSGFALAYPPVHYEAAVRASAPESGFADSWEIIRFLEKADAEKVPLAEIIRRKWPGKEWTMEGDTYQDLIWLSEGDPPTEKQILRHYKGVAELIQKEKTL